MNKQILRNVIFTGLFLVPFIPFLVYSGFFFPFITTKAFTWRIIVEIVFAVWLLLALLVPEYRPKKSTILYAVLAFIAVIGLADLFGVAPIKSFWSNFERMEGFVTLLHLGMFFIVISSVFREIEWNRWWNTTLAASFLMVLYCVFQIIGVKDIHQGGVRLDGTFGNAIYLAVYMLFHIFIALLFFWREWKNVGLRWVYGILILTQAIILYHTATRGAILGLIVGLFVMAVLNIRNKENHFVRKVSISALVGLVILIGGFISIRNSEFVTSSPVLSRFSSISTENLNRQGRYFVWPIALQGVKERPFLGWGQENFNYVFQEHYSPEMYHLEPWFDRAHNIFLDWAVTGGLLGLTSYLLLYVALIFSIWKLAVDLSHAEKSILTGLIATYFFHNFFVFDHLISYILFFSLLAYIHSRSSGELFWKQAVSEIQVKRLVLPAVSILLILSLYFINIKPIITNVSLIEALKSLQTQGGMSSAIKYFAKAYNASSLGRPEVVEHAVSNSVPILMSNISMEEKNVFYAFAKDSIIKQTEDFKKNDARYELIAGSFLSTVGSLDEALIHLQRARELMPGKQQIYFEIGAVHINKNERVLALEAFRIAYEMEPGYPEAGIIYLIGAIYADDRALEEKLIRELPEEGVTEDSRVSAAYKAVGR